MRFRHDNNNGWNILALIIVTARTITIVIIITIVGQVTNIKREVKEEENIKEDFKFWIILK